VSKLGAKKKREQGWILIPFSEPPPPEPFKEDRVYAEEEVVLAGELALLFMLMFVDREKEPGRWYRLCVENAWSLPVGSYRQNFFWAMRGLREEGTDLDSFRQYLKWKTNEYDVGHIHRDGPRW
jgi:hypothetical protein